MPAHDRRPRFTPRLDALEARETPAQFGVPWGDPTHLTISFAPDGTQAAGTASGLFAKLDAAMPRAVWQGTILRAFETWAELAGLNVGLVADGGQTFGTPGPTQRDARFGDVRIAGLPMGAGQMGEAVPPDPFFSGTLAGDVFLNTDAAFDPTSLYAVALHEAGHALGLAPSTDPRSVMYNRLNLNATPSAGDVAAIQSLYGTRAADPNEGAKGNDTVKNATRIRYTETAGVDDPSLPAVGFGDITTRADVDTFAVDAPLGYSGPTTFRLQTAGVSLLAARETILDGNGRVLGTATGDGSVGGVLTVTLPAVSPGSRYYVRVEAAPNGPVGVGRYGLGVTFDRLAEPTATPLEAVLRGPYGTLARDDLGRLFRDPAHAFVGDDAHTNDGVATATALSPLPGFAANTRYRTLASLSDSADADFYRVRAPDVRTPVVLTVTVRAVEPNGTAPRVEVFDGNMARVPAQVLANGNGTFTVQAAGVAANRGSYYVRVFSAGATGNYSLDVGFGSVAAEVRQFAAGAVSAAAPQAAGRLYVGQTQLFGFALSAAGAPGSGSVRFTITNSAGAVVYSLTAAAGDTVTDVTALLTPGEYTVRFTLLPGSNPAAGPLTFSLKGNSLTDPVGPVATNPTLAPQYQAPQNPVQFLYPNGTLTLDPYLWLFGLGG